MWRLVNLAEVVCERIVNQQLVDGARLHVCEDTNSLINDRTVPSREITRGRFYVFGKHCLAGRPIELEQRDYARHLIVSGARVAGFGQSCTAGTTHQCELSSLVVVSRFFFVQRSSLW